MTHLPATSNTIGGQALPSGWIVQRNYQTDDSTSREVVVAGPGDGVAAARAAVVAGLPGCKVRVSWPPSSQIATITASHDPGGSGTTEADAIVAPDDYQLTPTTVTVALQCAPQFAGISGEVCAIDAALETGETARCLAAATSATGKKYLALRLAGITTYNTVAVTYQLTRHYAVDRDVSSFIAAAIQAQGQCFAWSGVIGSSDAPFPEPKFRIWNGTTATTYVYKWQLVGVPVTGRSDELTVGFVYQGAWGYASALYQGGDYTPPLPSAS